MGLHHYVRTGRNPATLGGFQQVRWNCLWPAWHATIVPRGIVRRWFLPERENRIADGCGEVVELTPNWKTRFRSAKDARIVTALNAPVPLTVATIVLGRFNVSRQLIL